MIKSIFSSTRMFFASFVPNFKRRQLSDAQLRTFVSAVGLGLITLAAIFYPQAGAHVVFFSFYFALVSPDLAGLGLQKKKVENLKAGFRNAQKAFKAASFTKSTLATVIADTRTFTQRQRDAKGKKNNRRRRK